MVRRVSPTRLAAAHSKGSPRPWHFPGLTSRWGVQREIGPPGRCLPLRSSGLPPIYRGFPASPAAEIPHCKHSQPLISTGQTPPHPLQRTVWNCPCKLPVEYLLTGKE